MKRLLSTSLLLVALASAFTGCLKDKGFDNYTYGINDPDTQQPGVGFPLGTGATARNDYGLNVSSSPQVVDGFVFVNLESGVPAKSDVHVTLSNQTAAILTAYQGAGGPIQILPPALFSVATALTIPAGGRFVSVPITVSNTTTLNPNLAYAVGLTITTVDGGYKIADNLKNLLIVFSIKNQYDGIYQIEGEALRAGDAVLSGHIGPAERAFATSGPNSVQWLGTVPWANGSGTRLPDGYEPNITFTTPPPAPPAVVPVTSITSPNGIFMTAPVVRTDVLLGSVQRYNPTNKTIYFEFSYGGGPASRLFSFTAKYLRAR